MIRLYTDHYFHIGAMHLTSGKPCQDYAISGVYDDVALAIISDGCSSGRHTDVGSRILALSTATAIREHWMINRDSVSKSVSEEVALRQKILSIGTRQTLGLQTQDMLATCVYAYISLTGGFLHIQGDGVIALKYKNGEIDLHKFEWADNTPYYPAYNENGLSDFIETHGNDLKALRLSQATFAKETNGEFMQLVEGYHSLSEGIRGITIEINKEKLQELEFIALFSDGVTQIDNFDWKDAVIMFMSFKNTTGEFAKRRMIRGIKDTQKNGRGPIDDISFAVIRMEAQNE